VVHAQHICCAANGAHSGHLVRSLDLVPIVQL
jgi:hypothetical protein